MIKLTYAIRKRPDLTDEEFHRYWKDVHGPFVAKLLPIVSATRYVQSHFVDTPINDVLRQSRGHQVKPFDGITEIWWDSVEDSWRATARLMGSKLASNSLRTRLILSIRPAQYRSSPLSTKCSTEP